MGIVNVMEDTVRAAVNDVLQENSANGVSLEGYREDIVAYVLNRIPTKYITGERGLLHTRIDYDDSTQFKVDILLQVHEALRIVQRRRPASQPINIESFKKEYYFPYVVGEVLEEISFTAVPDVEASLCYNGRSAKMIDNAWENPYKTCRATKGFYLFWPDFIISEMIPHDGVEFGILFRHADYYEKTISFRLNVFKGYNFNRYKVIPISLLRLRE